MVRTSYTVITNGPSSARTQSWLMKIQDLSRVLMFMLGLCSGMMFSVIFFTALRRSNGPVQGQPQLFNYRLESSDDHLKDVESLRVDHSMNETYHLGEDIVADKLRGTVRILCVVQTSKTTYKINAEAVKNTWGKRCNTLLFVSNFEDSSLPVLKLVEGENYLSKWGLMKGAIKHAYIHLLDTHDWVVRADDTTFMVVENLRYLLSAYDPSQALYLGCRFKRDTVEGFMSEGAGYVLSREAVVRMVREGLPFEVCYVGNDGTEDVEMGKCMASLNVTFVDTRDSLGRGRFFPMTPENHLIPNAIPKNHWYWDLVYYPPATGYNCCSDNAISFHGLPYQRMYTFNYLIYHLRPYGISSHPPFTQTDIHVIIK